MLYHYGLQVVTPATQEPLTVGELKAHSRVLSCLDDGAIATYGAAARSFVENFTGRACCVTGFRLTLNQWPSDELFFPRAPVQALSAVQYIDSAGTTQTLTSGQYSLVQMDGGQVLQLGYGIAAPESRRQLAAVTVEFTAGYAPIEPLPDAMRQAICMLAGHYYENREAVVVGTVANDIPLGVEALLIPYKLMWL